MLVGPGWTNGVKTAVQYVNKYLGGVQGHPLVVSYCFTTSAEEEGTKCGQQFANNNRIKVVEFGAVAVGNQSFYAALGNKKPTVGGVELLPVDAQRKNGFALFGTNDSVLGPWGTLGKNVLHAKTAAVVYSADPRDRLRREGREGEPRVGRDQDDAGRLPAHRDRPDGAAHRGRRAERRHDRAAVERGRLRQHRQGALAARQEQHAGRLEPALPRPGRSGGSRRRPAEVDLRDRLVARLRHDRSRRSSRSSGG